MGGQAAPKVEIDAETSAGRVLVRVRDNGIGVEPEHHEKIFGLFERLNPASEGTGLGLALARRVVEAQGGKLWVESQGAGGGATFCFTLPPA